MEYKKLQISWHDFLKQTFFLRGKRITKRGEPRIWPNTIYLEEGKRYIDTPFLHLKTVG